MQQIILNSGKKTPLPHYQSEHNLETFQAAPNFSVNELSCGKELMIAHSLLILIQSFRDHLNNPVKINSGFRSLQKQEELKSAGYKTAKTSPHCYGMAADLDTLNWEQTLLYVTALKQLAKRKNITIRLGYRQYHIIGQSFIHLDVCPMFYAAGKPYHDHPHPWQWEKAIEW